MWRAEKAFLSSNIKKSMLNLRPTLETSNMICLRTCASNVRNILLQMNVGVFQVISVDVYLNQLQKTQVISSDQAGQASR